MTVRRRAARPTARAALRGADRAPDAAPSTRRHSGARRAARCRRAGLARATTGGPRFDAVRGAAGRVEPPLHAVHRPARRRAGRRAPRDRRRRDRSPGDRACPRAPTPCVELVEEDATSRSDCRDAGARRRRDRRRRPPTRDPDAGARRCSTTARRLPADDKFAQLTRAVWTPGPVVIDVPGRRPLDQPIVVRWALGDAGRALARAHVHPARRRRARRRSSRSSSLVRPAPLGDGPRRSSPARPRSASGRTAGSARQPPGAAGRTGRVPAPRREHRRGRRRSTGRSPSSAAGSCAAAIDNRLEGDRSSVEQVEIVFGGADQLFDLTSYTRHVGRDTTGNLLSKGALLDRARTLHEGPDHDRADARSAPTASSASSG